jgi:AcrR family transcriptional regulator
MTTRRPSRQAQKTRGALLQAFNALVLERRYDDIRIADIIGRADVGRSTFYMHFRDKDDLLRQSLSGILSILADAADEDCDMRKLQIVLDHFRDNLQRARGMLNGPVSPKVVEVLGGLIAERLAARNAGREPAGVIPLELAAAQVAEATLGLVRAWLNGGASCSSASVARALHSGAAALARNILCT